MSVLALVIAVVAGAAVAGLSQLTAVSVVDPRPSLPLSNTPTAAPTPIVTSLPTETAPATATVQPPSGQVWLYTIADGDSISGIAIRFGTTTEQLLAMNPEYADNQDLVEAGLQMIMPCTLIAAAEDRC
jgi:LysM repeat protein